MLWWILAACGDAGSDSTGVDGGGSGSGHHHEQPPALALDGDPKSGAAIFQKTCGDVTCHGPDGSGGSTDAKDLGKVVPVLTDEDIVDVMEKGFLVMPPQHLEDQEEADVLSFLRQEWGG